MTTALIKMQLQNGEQGRGGREEKMNGEQVQLSKNEYVALFAYRYGQCVTRLDCISLVQTYLFCSSRFPGYMSPLKPEFKPKNYK